VRIVFCDNKIQGKFLTGFAFDVKSSPVPRRDVLSRTPITELSLLSTSAGVYCEPWSATDQGTLQKKKCSSRALSVNSEEQCECNASRGSNDVLLFTSLWVKRPVHELERVNFWTGRVPALLYLSVVNGV